MKKITLVALAVCCSYQYALAQPDMSIGQKAPGFSGISVNGEEINLKKLRGNIVVLDFWFVGCGGCRAEMPFLNQMVKELGQDRIAYIGIALDKPDKIRLFLKDIPFDFTHIPEAEKIFNSYGVTICPSRFVIDPKGRISYISRGKKMEKPETMKEHIQILHNELTNKTQ